MRHQRRGKDIDMERKYRVGEHVVFVNQVSVPRDAVVTIWWSGKPQYAPENPNEPGCNLAFISGDPSRDDPYGRQMERETSVVHKTNQPAHGFYWCWPDELDDGQRQRLNADKAT